MSVTSPSPGWKYCGDCARQMRVTEPKCSFCGWTDPNAGRGGEGDGGRGQCAYELNGERCPLPGVFSGAVTGKTDHWWCFVHAGERHYDAEAARELQEIIENPRAIMARPCGRWGDGHERSRVHRWRDEMVTAMAAGHEEWQRRDDETRSEYGSRMAKIGRELAGRLRRKMARIQSTPGDRGAGQPNSVAISGSPAPASSPAPSVQERVEDAMDHVLELAAKHEEEGFDTETAQRMAFEHVLEVRARSWAGA